MEIKDFALLMWRNARYWILGLALGVVLGLVVSSVQRPTYEAATQVLVSRPRLQGSIDVLPIGEDQLVITNALLVKTKPVRDAAGSELGTKVSAAAIQVTALPNSYVIEIRVQDTDAPRAAAIANELVKILVQTNSDLLSERYAALDSALNTQIDQVQTQMDGLRAQFNQMNAASIREQLAQVNVQIDQLNSQISDLEQELGKLPTNPTAAQGVSVVEKQAQLQQLRSQLNLYKQIQVNLTFIGKPGQGGVTRDDPSLTLIQSTLNLYQQVYLGLLSSLEASRSARLQSISDIIQVEPAVAPKAPISPRPVLYTLFGGVVGFFLSISAILVVDHINRPLTTARGTEELLGVPVLGVVPDANRAKDGLASLYDPGSAGSEAFRALAASVELVNPEPKLSTLMVANVGKSESKTAVAANLAIAYAQQGKAVILLDGDLWHPRLHGLFGLASRKGPAGLIRVKKGNKGVGYSVEELEEWDFVPGGIVPEGPTGWLDAEKWASVLAALRKQADLVIVESPWSELADAQTLASNVEVVLLVIRSGRTHADAARTALRRLQAAGASVVGTAMVHVQRAQSPSVRILSWAETHFRNKEARSAGASIAGDSPTVPVSSRNPLAPQRNSKRH